jgi:hypothetical protein
MDCVNQVLDFYNNKSNEDDVDLHQFHKVWFSNLLIKIMNNFAEHKTNELELRNCLVLLVNLFSYNENPDHYNLKGKNSRDLVDEERANFKEIMRNEFLNT